MTSFLFDKYRLLAELGSGARAEVFIAVKKDPKGIRYDELFVLKKLGNRLGEDPEIIGMFLEESRVATILDHPSVARTHEIGQMDGEYFLAMEYLDGQTVAQVRERSKKAEAAGETGLTMAAEFAVLLDVLSGLQYAHELRASDGKPLHVVHRALTPKNVFVTYEGDAKVLDFGLGKLAARTHHSRTGSINGRARYMAPEQALGKAVDSRADVFAVGVMLFEAATRRSFWGAENDVAVLKGLSTGTYPTSPKSLVAGTPDEIDAICRKCLAYKGAERYESAEALRVELKGALEKLGMLEAGKNDLLAFMQTAFVEKREKARSVIAAQLHEIEKAERDPRRGFSIRPLRDREDGEDRKGRRRSVSPRWKRWSGRPNASRSNPPRVAGKVLEGKGDAKREGTVEKLYDTRESSSEQAEDFSLITDARAKAGRSYVKELSILSAACVAIVALLKFVPQQHSSMPATVDTLGASPGEMRQKSGLPSPINLEREVSIWVRCDVPGSSIEIDGRPVANPLEATFAFENGAHTIVVKASGHKPYVETLSFHESVRLVVGLEPVGSSKESTAIARDVRPARPVSHKPKVGN